MADMRPIAVHFEEKLKEALPEYSMFEMIIKESETTVSGERNLNNIMSKNTWRSIFKMCHGCLDSSDIQCL